jgi:hypothetical protein
MRQWYSSLYHQRQVIRFCLQQKLSHWRCTHAKHLLCTVVYSRSHVPSNVFHVDNDDLRDQTVSHPRRQKIFMVIAVTTSKLQLTVWSVNHMQLESNSYHSATTPTTCSPVPQTGTKNSFLTDNRHSHNCGTVTSYDTSFIWMPFFKWDWSSILCTDTHHIHISAMYHWDHNSTLILLYWDLSCVLLKANGCSGGTRGLHCHSRGISQARNKQKLSRESLVYVGLLTGLFIVLEDGGDVFLQNTSHLPTDFQFDN